MTKKDFEHINSTLPPGVVLVQGYEYKDPATGTEMLKFHVDDHDCMQKLGVDN
jgi:hypothetical protein